MSTADDVMAEKCMAIVAQIDEKLQEPGNEEALEFWSEGDFDAVAEKLSTIFPEVTEEQWTWIEEFLSEM